MKHNQCAGLLGWLFGHKYLKSRGDYTYRSIYCFRCGRTIGGS
jgi:hypothetical protein